MAETRFVRELDVPNCDDSKASSLYGAKVKNPTCDLIMHCKGDLSVVSEAESTMETNEAIFQSSEK